MAVCAGLELYKFSSASDQALYAVLGDARQLPTGVIVALAVFGPARAPHIGPHSPFEIGPRVHDVLAVLPLYWVQPALPHKGNQFLTPLDVAVSERLLSMSIVTQQLTRWTQEFDLELGAIMGLSVQQPPAQAIAVGLKTVENRGRSLFLLRARVEDSAPLAADNIAGVAVASRQLHRQEAGVVSAMPAEPAESTGKSSVPDLTFTDVIAKLERLSLPL